MKEQMKSKLLYISEIKFLSNLHVSMSLINKEKTEHKYSRA